MINAANHASFVNSLNRPESGLVAATVAGGPDETGAFTLRLDGGREVSARIADKNVTLTPGQSVMISPSDGKILIPDPAQARQSPPPQPVADNDVFTSGERAGLPQNAAKNAPPQNSVIIAGFTISQEKVQADGIYKHDTAGHIFGKAAVDGEMPEGDYAAVRLATTAGRQTVAVVTGENLRAAIEEIRAGFESPLLRSLPVELLEEIFNERGGLDVDALKTLDALLRNRSLSVDPAQQQQMERVGQWLRIALDNPDIAPELAARVPITGAKETAALMELLGRISAFALPNGAGLALSPELFFATEWKVVGNGLSSAAVAAAAGKTVAVDPGANAGNNADVDRGGIVNSNVSSNNNVIGNKNPIISNGGNGANVNPNVDSNNNAIGNKSPVISNGGNGANINPNVDSNNNVIGNKNSTISNGVNVNTNANINNNVINNKNSTISNGGNGVNVNTNANINNNVINNKNSTISNGGNGANVNTNVNSANSSSAAFNSVRGELFENLCKSTFSAAPSALLDLVRRIDSSNVSGGAQLPSAEARRIVDELLSRLPAQAAAKPERLHDSRLLSMQNLNAEIAAPPRLPAHASAIPMIRSEFAGLTEAAVQALSDGDGEKAAKTVSERVDAIRELVGKISTAESGAGRDVNALDKNIAGSRPPITADGAGLNGSVANKTPAGNGFPTPDQNGINRKPSMPANEAKANHTVDNRQNAIAADKSSAIDKSSIMDKSPVTDRLPANDKSLAADKPPTVNGPSVIDKQPAADKPSVSAAEVRADAPAKTVDVQAVKDNAMKIVDDLMSAVDTVAGKAARDGKLDAGQKIELLNAVRDAVSSLDAALRPIAGEERPVPAAFYERVISAPRRQISADTKNALFSQIGAAQESIRRAIQAVEAEPAAVDKAVVDKRAGNVIGNVTPRQSSDNRNAANTVSNVMPPPSSDNKNAAIVNNNIPSQQSSDDKNAVNTANSTALPSDGKSAANANAINNIAAQPSPNDKAAARTVSNVPTPQPSDSKTTLSVNNNIQTPPPSYNKETSNIITVATHAPDVFLQAARRLWANTEKLRAGFQEAFSSLDLPSRVSPLDPSGEAAARALRQSVDALRTEILLDVSKALREIFSSVGELSETVEEFSDRRETLPESERALLRAAESLERQARQSGAEVMEKLKDVLRELNRAQADVSREHGAGARQSPADVIRSAALTAARGLESLQLLSAQTRGADIQQQVFALPVKIGQEWTEVQVKFIKDRRRGGKKEGGGHVSVYLNVAPSALGEVGAHLDFHPPASLKLSLLFAKPEATRWFRERAGELREALANAGLPGAALEFHNMRARTENAAAQTRDGAEPSTVGGGRKTGKVDFKA